MEQFIIEFVKDNGCGYVKINCGSDLLIIYDLFKNGVVGDYYNSIICLYYGLYYQVSKNYDLMKKYCLLSIKHNNDYAMYYLGNYYEYIENNMNLMVKYYLMSVKNNNIFGIQKCFDIYKEYSRKI